MTRSHDSSRQSRPAAEAADRAPAVPESGRDPDEVQRMFDRVSPRYDLVNTLLSFGRDEGWRRAAARATGLRPGGRALDVACGSGRLVARLARRAGPDGRCVGLDFSPGMLQVAARWNRGLPFVRGDALRLPFGEGTFQAVTIAFGLRNLVDPAAGLREMIRVLAPEGRAVVLEFVRPPGGVIGWTYRLHLRHILPRVGGMVSGQPGAYRYLSDTVDSYRTLAELGQLAESAGWARIELRGLMLGTVGLVVGQRASGQ